MHNISTAFFGSYQTCCGADEILQAVKNEIDRLVRHHGGATSSDSNHISGAVYFRNTHGGFLSRDVFLIPMWPGLFLLYDDARQLPDGLDTFYKTLRALGWMCWTFRRLDEAVTAVLEEFVLRMLDYENAKQICGDYPSSDHYPMYPVFSPAVASHLLAESDRLHLLNSYDFERLLADIFHCDGYAVVRTISMADRELGDLFLFESQTPFPQHLIVEAKRFNKERTVGLSAVRQLWYGVEKARATAGVLATTSSFARTVVSERQQSRWRLHLRDGEWLKSWLNRHVETIRGKQGAILECSLIDGRLTVRTV